MNSGGYYIATVSSPGEAGRESIIPNLTFLYILKVWLIEMNCNCMTFRDFFFYFSFIYIYFALGNSSTNVMSLEKAFLENKDKKDLFDVLKI